MHKIVMGFLNKIQIVLTEKKNVLKQIKNCSSNNGTDSEVQATI